MKRLLFTLILIASASLMNRGSTQQLPSATVSAIDWSPYGSHLLITQSDGGIYIVDSMDQAITTLISPDVTGPIEDAALQPGGVLIATVDRGNALNIWDRLTGEHIRILSNLMVPYRVDWSPDGQYLITGNTNELMVRDADGDQLFPVGFAYEDIPNVAFSPDSALLLLSFSAKVEIWDVVAREMIARNIVGGLRQSIQWNSDATAFLAANIDNTTEGRFHNIVLIDTVTGERLRTYSGFPNQLTAAYWSPDESQIAATSIDGRVYLIDAVSGDITTVYAGAAPLLTFDWSPYGAQIAIGALRPIDESLNSAYAAVPVRFLVPDPTPARLQAIADMCGAPLAVDRPLDTAIASGDYAGVIAQVQSLPDGTIPSACAADLIAVAQAIAAQGGE